MRIERGTIDEIVTLDPYNSDLNLSISEFGCAANPLTNEGFAYLWAGARATHGVLRGKFCFEVKVVNHLFLNLSSGHKQHGLQVGFSTESSSLQLGEDPLSYSYDETGKISTNCKFKNYGQRFAVGDVIMGVVNMDSDVTLIGFVKNGEFLGWAYEVPKDELNGQALFPHVLTKNVSYEVNFGQKVEPYFPMPSILKDYVFIDCIPLGQRQSGTQAPKEKKDCEMIMMCGLTGAGKSTWANNYSKQFPEKKFNVFSMGTIMKKMKVVGTPEKLNFSGGWNCLIEIVADCVNKLLEKGSHLKRNYIWDQTNIDPAVQREKMQIFEGFQRKAVVVIPSETEYHRRCDKREREICLIFPDNVLLKQKAKFKLPEVNDIFDEVIYPELPLREAQILVSDYNEAGKKAAREERLRFPGYNEAAKETQIRVPDNNKAGKKAAVAHARKLFKPNDEFKNDNNKRLNSGENCDMPVQDAYLSSGARGYKVRRTRLRGRFGRSVGGLGGIGLNQENFNVNPRSLEDNSGGFDDSLRGSDGKIGFNSNRKSFDGNCRGLRNNHGSIDKSHTHLASNHGVFDSKHGDFYRRPGVFGGSRNFVGNHERLNRIRGGHNGRGGCDSYGFYRNRGGFENNLSGFIRNKSGCEGDKDLINDCDAEDIGGTGPDHNRRFGIFSRLSSSNDNEGFPGPHINYPPVSRSFSPNNPRGLGFRIRRGVVRSSSGEPDSFGNEDLNSNISGQLSSSNYRKETILETYPKSICRCGRLHFPGASQNVPFENNNWNSQTGNDIFNRREYGSGDLSRDTTSTNRAESQREYGEISGELKRKTKSYTRRETDNYTRGETDNDCRGETGNYTRRETSYVPQRDIKNESATESAPATTVINIRTSGIIIGWSARMQSSDNPDSSNSSEEENSTSYIIRIRTEPLDDVIPGHGTYRGTSSASYVPSSQSNRGMQSYGYASSAASSQQQAGEELSTINSSVLASQDQQGFQSVPEQAHPNQYYRQSTSENPSSYGSTHGSK